MAIAKLMEVGEIAAAIKEIIGQKAQLEAAVQKAGVHCIGQSIVHGNITPARELHLALKGGVRRDSLLKFFEVYGNMQYSKITKQIEFVRTYQPSIWTEEHVQRLMQTAWYEAKKDPDPVSVYDCEGEVSKFIERMKKSLAQFDKQPSAGIGTVTQRVTVKNVEVFDAIYHAYINAVADLSSEKLKGMKQLSDEEQRNIVGAAKDAELKAEAEAKQAAREAASPEAIAALQQHFGKPEVKAA